ncbi:MAG TPA: ATP-binding cassette domain-containing protein [Dokdonella sp.]|uniref:ABC-F family ATP-binding cassette domain-containing protein n=1 Tax=Dokdonella sp. TaxID=2291710 RepID=UPI002C4B5626|nr:ATP-binding cassette domain-containing protein [Dokdonella sp.]HUD42383.1 ATP-binding cassette domain-containing protein [Dokdonella sp.]
MLRFDHLSLRRGFRLLLNDTTFFIHAGWRVGLTGRNGTGKSSLLALIGGELTPDAGDFSRPREWTLAHVRQETPALARSALDYALDGDAEFRRLEAELAAAEAAHDALAQGRLHERMQAIGGYAAKARAAELLNGLGFAPGDETRPVSAFSGGWRMRLNLAQALMCRSDLLLLDEPTNHLDLDAVLWLEDWLRRYPGTLIVVSHDREFLDAVVTHVLHLADANAEIFSGDVSHFERKRAERLIQQQALAERQQRQRAHMQSFVDRFKAKASKARQAQSRLKALERMALVAPVRVESGITFSFAEPAAVPAPLLVLDQAAVGYAGRHIVEHIGWTLRAGDRIGLLGANGAGKSTLVKLIAGTLAPLAGERREGKGLVVGYFAQHQLEQLDPQATPVAHLLRLQADLGEQAARDFLGGFGFSGERALSEVGGFSGGEKARLALALVVFRKPNLLLLDEPTNHLDADTREALAEALQDFAGAIVLVAHDRALLRATCDEYRLVRDGRAGVFDGDLDDYAALVLRKTPPPGSEAAAAGASRRDDRRERAEQRAKLAPLRREAERIEKRLAALERERSEVETALADPALYDGAQAGRIAELTARRGRIGSEIATLEDAWLAGQAALEEATASA